MRVFAAREQVVERLRAVADHLQAVGHVGLGEGDAGQFDVVRVVLDQQDVFLAHARFPESGTAGSSTKKVLPAPGSDCAQTRPPWRSATQRTMARPRPLPPACSGPCRRWNGSNRSEEHTSELQSLMRNSYAVFCLKKKKTSTPI